MNLVVIDIQCPSGYHIGWRPGPRPASGRRTVRDIPWGPLFIRGMPASASLSKPKHTLVSPREASAIGKPGFVHFDPLHTAPEASQQCIAGSGIRKSCRLVILTPPNQRFAHLGFVEICGSEHEPRATFLPVVRAARGDSVFCIRG